MVNACSPHLVGGGRRGGEAEMLIEWNFTKVVLTGLWEFSNDFGL